MQQDLISFISIEFQGKFLQRNYVVMALYQFSIVCGVRITSFKEAGAITWHIELSTVVQFCEPFLYTVQ